jgi:signal transduction histidine kinase/CheY-like chemotaxis protein
VDPGKDAEDRNRVAALLEASELGARAADLDEALAQVSRVVRRVLALEACTVFLYDAEAQVLKPVACEGGRGREQRMALRLRLGEGITGTVALTGRAEIVPAAESDWRSAHVSGTPNDEHTALLCAPITIAGRTAGVLTLTRLDPRPFDAEDIPLAALFAAECARTVVARSGAADLREAFRDGQAYASQLSRLNALGEMAGGVAHDFNNILAAILGRTQLLLQQSSSLEIRGQLRVIEQAALDGAQAVRRVQEFTRVRHDSDFETLDLNQIVEGAVELTRPVWEEGGQRRGVAIELAIDLAAEQRVAGNASELREVFTNLILNAVDAMPWGGELRIHTRDEAGNVVVKIADTGVGISAEARPRIFDPFFTTKPGKGTGLGLSVAYGIVTRHAGAITVESEPHTGTEFTVRVPVGAIAPPSGVSGAVGELPRFRVLVVDDEQVVLDVLADLLKALGQQVTTALGGIAGRNAIASGEFDLVVSDLGMPELNGWDLALAVKAARQNVGMVLITGWGTQLEGGAAQAHGVDLVMSKPVTLSDLDRALRHLGAAHGRRAA